MNNVVIGILGSRLDHAGLGKRRYGKWRPSVSIPMQKGFEVSRFELIHHPDDAQLAKVTKEDIESLSPGTTVHLHLVHYENPWDFEAVYSELHHFAEQYTFKPEQENYFIHITTGTHVAQICLFLLTEAKYMPGKLLQSSPGKQGDPDALYGTMQTIDLDLSKYDQIASRFAAESANANRYLKDGIETRNHAFNQMIEQIEQVAIKSSAPILLTGPTGAGKSRLAKRIFALKKQRMQLQGRLVEVNCATLRGDNAMSTLFGHTKGSFTGAQRDRGGLLREADQGVLFLDEIGELGLDEQAMLLRALEDKLFTPLGSDKEVSSNFQLIAGTNRDLNTQIEEGKFREDLLARINLWAYELPSLKQRIEDLEPNIQYELKHLTKIVGYKVSFNEAAYQHYIDFSTSHAAQWSANFRDLNASITRMATLATGGRITIEIVNSEVTRLKTAWQGKHTYTNDKKLKTLEKTLGPEKIAEMDLFDQLQLSNVINVCQNSNSLAEAGRKLYDQSRRNKAKQNDSHRLKVYLAKYGLEFKSCK